MRTGLECEWLRLRLASFRCGSGSLLQGSDLVDIKPGFVEISCCDHTQLRAWTTEKAFRAADILEAAHRRVQDGVLTKGDYDHMEMSAGRNRNPLGLLACRTLRSRGVNDVMPRVAVLPAVSPSPLPDVGGTRCHHPHFVCEDFIAELTLRRLLYVRQHFDIQSMTYDWVHTLLQHGVMNTEIQGLLAWCSDLGITRETIRTFEGRDLGFLLHHH